MIPVFATVMGHGSALQAVPPTPALVEIVELRVTNRLGESKQHVLKQMELIHLMEHHHHHHHHQQQQHQKKIELQHRKKDGRTGITVETETEIETGGEGNVSAVNPQMGKQLKEILTLSWRMAAWCINGAHVAVVASGIVLHLMPLASQTVLVKHPV